MDKAVEALQKSLIRPFEKAPGWTLVVAFWYIVLVQPVAGGPINVRVVSAQLPGSSLALWVGVLTLVSYKAGDLWDGLMFDSLRRLFGTSRLTRIRWSARNELGVQRGRYRVALALSRAAHRVLLVNALNETAKATRSLALPFLAGALFCIKTNLALAGVLAVSCIVSAVVYAWPKTAHMTRLYGGITKIAADPKCGWEDLEHGARLFFWSGELVVSGSRDYRIERRARVASVPAASGRTAGSFEGDTKRLVVTIGNLVSNTSTLLVAGIVLFMPFIPFALLRRRKTAR